MLLIGFDKTPIQAVVLSRKRYLRLLLSNSEINSLESKTVVDMIDFDRSREDLSADIYVQSVNCAWSPRP